MHILLNISTKAYIPNLFSSHNSTSKLPFIGNELRQKGVRHIIHKCAHRVKEVKVAYKPTEGLDQVQD